LERNLAAEMGGLWDFCF